MTTTRQAGRLDRLGRFAIRRRRSVFAAAIGFVLLAAGIGGDAANRLSIAGFDDPGSPSVRAGRDLQRQFHVTTPNFVLRVSSRRGVDDREVAAQGKALARRLSRERGVLRVDSYWTADRAAATRMRSRDGHSALVLAQISGNEDQASDRSKPLVGRYGGRHGVLQVGVTGLGPLLGQGQDQAKKDLVAAERIALPLTLLALVLVFRGVVAAVLPLALGGLAILGTLLVLRLLTMVADVSIFAVNLTTALGLGLAIDYSLFIVMRYRDELAAGAGVNDAIVTSMRTAGRAVAYSAATVAISLAALLVFPQYYLRSFAYAGVAVTVLAAVGALVVMPALLSKVGTRIDALSLGRRRGAATARETGFWQRFAEVVMRRPIPIATVAILLLLLLASPLRHISFNFSDDRTLPASSPPRAVADKIRAEFPLREAGTMYALADGAQPGRALTRYARRLSRVNGVLAVDAYAGTFRGGRLVAPRPPAERRAFASPHATWLSVETDREAYANPGERVGRALRAVRAPFHVRFAGIPLRLADTKDKMLERLPIALAMIVITTFLALFAMTGSVVAPVKALIVNTLSLFAVLGAIVYVFQDGHLQWLVGDFTLTGGINVLNPPLIFAIAFGLSMDYEVFMLSRIKERYDELGDNTAAVASGLQRTAPIITAAAAVMAIVFVSFGTSAITNLKMVGFGLALAVLLDATIVRAVLVPAVMRLAGNFNWWAPRLVRTRGRGSARFGKHQAEVVRRL